MLSESRKVGPPEEASLAPRSSSGVTPVGRNPCEERRVRQESERQSISPEAVEMELIKFKIINLLEKLLCPKLIFLVLV